MEVNGKCGPLLRCKRFRKKNDDKIMHGLMREGRRLPVLYSTHSTPCCESKKYFSVCAEAHIRTGCEVENRGNGRWRQNPLQCHIEVRSLALNDRQTNLQDTSATLSQPKQMQFYGLEKCHATKKRDKQSSRQQ